VKYLDLLDAAVRFHRKHPTLWIPHPDLTKDPKLPQIVGADEVCNAVASDTGRQIKVVRVPVRGEHCGQVWVREKSALIEIGSPENRCWTRFIQVKEAMHVLHPVAPNFDDAHGIAWQAMRSRVEDADPDKKLDPETTAIYFAMEILIPVGSRGVISDWQHHDHFTNRIIAHRLMVPWEAINLYFELGYAAMAAQIHAKLK
jgi:hypothetical protein